MFLLPPPHLYILEKRSKLIPSTNQPTLFSKTMPTQKPSVILSVLASADLLFTARFFEKFNIPQPFSVNLTKSFVFKNVKLSAPDVISIFQWIQDSKAVDIRDCVKWLAAPKPGQKLWHNWVLKHVQPPLNQVIENALAEKGIHPMTLSEEVTGWPALHAYGSSAYLGAVLELFGLKALSGNSTTVLKLEMQTAIAQLIAHAWARIYKVYNRKEAAAQKKKTAFDQLWAGVLH
jgi:hypothetical protein